MNKAPSTTSQIDRRLRRSATALGEIGPRILSWLQQPEQRTALVKAAEDGMPSVAGISSSFAQMFGADAGKTSVIRQFVGRAVKVVMEQESYVPADTGVKLPRDTVFTSGTRYRPRTELPENSDGSSLLRRFIATLDHDELRAAALLVRQNLENL